jgi:hypothetical protein
VISQRGDDFLVKACGKAAGIRVDYQRGGRPRGHSYHPPHAIGDVGQGR